MLAGARARLARDPALAGRLELVRGEAEQLPFADGEFDALTFTYLLRYVDDRAATMGELARVVRPGGRIGMLEFGSAPGRAAEDCLARVHARGAAADRQGRFAGLAGGGEVPGAEHRAAGTPGARPACAVEFSRDPQRPRAPDELRRRTAHVGHERWRPLGVN